MTTAAQNASAGVYVTDDIGLEVTDGTNSRVQLGLLPSGTYGLRVVAADGTTVIIDGTSDMFKIAAKGTQSVTITAGNLSNTASTSITLSNPASNTPLVICHHVVGSVATLGTVAMYTDSVFTGGAGNGVLFHEFCWGEITAVTTTSVTLALKAWRDTNVGSVTYQQSYYVLQEVAF